MAVVVQEPPFEEEGDHLDLFVKSYLHGKCYLFALALHAGLRLPIVGLVEKGDSTIIAHAGVQAPEGLVMDIRGCLSTQDFMAPYGGSGHFLLRPVAPRLLYNTLVEEGGSPLEIRYEVQQARRLAEAKWPDLPWRNGFRDRVKNFAEELEALSRKHGLWIYGNYAASLPLIAEVFGGEAGYKLTPIPNGRSYGYAINRNLKN